MPAPESWWALELNELGLSQGDLVAAVTISTPLHPTTFVKKEIIAGRRTAWVEGSDPADNIVSKAVEVAHALVVTHSCDLDKNEKKGRVHVAPAFAANRLQPEVWETIATLRRRSMMPLPDVPGLGDLYADLRLIQPVDRRALDRRVVSMNDAAVERLRLQLAGFFSRAGH